MIEKLPKSYQLFAEGYFKLKDYRLKIRHWSNYIRRLLRRNAGFFSIFNRKNYQIWIVIEPNIREMLLDVSLKFFYNYELILECIDKPQQLDPPADALIHSYKCSASEPDIFLTYQDKGVLMMVYGCKGFTEEVVEYCKQTLEMFPNSLSVDIKEKTLAAYEVLKRCPPQPQGGPSW